jgi:hypothetical protein
MSGKGVIFAYSKATSGVAGMIQDLFFISVGQKNLKPAKNFLSTVQETNIWIRDVRS